MKIKFSGIDGELLRADAFFAYVVESVKSLIKEAKEQKINKYALIKIPKDFKAKTKQNILEEHPETVIKIEAFYDPKEIDLKEALKR